MQTSRQSYLVTPPFDSLPVHGEGLGWGRTQVAILCERAKPPRMALFWLGLVLMFTLVSCASDPEPPGPGATLQMIAKSYPAEQIKAGSANFSVYCIACHGKDAKGLPGLGLDLVTSAFVASHGDDELLAFIKVGRPIDDPANTTGVQMPAKGGFPNLTDEQLLAIIAHLRHLQAEGQDQ